LSPLTALNAPGWDRSKKPHLITCLPMIQTATFARAMAARRVNETLTIISTYVFDNDFPALLLPEGDGQLKQSGQAENDLFHVKAEFGIARVMCFSPRHDLTLPELPLIQVKDVVQGWVDQTEALGANELISYVQIFENKGAMMGASNPHPHNQIWASSHVPNEPAKEMAAMRKYQAQHDSCLICSYLHSEKNQVERVVTSNEHFVALVPFWAIWPFELLLISQRHLSSLTDLTMEERSSLADILRRVNHPL
jgi:UDPglucose--hexose-1-phosphate uridylyltransferase